MFSFWEQRAFLTTDYAVVGGGFTGLWTALALRERFPQARVTVLERGSLPTGASTRNAGFACFGSLTELLADASSMGIATMVGLARQRYDGLRRWRALFPDQALGYEPLGGYELLFDPAAADRVGELNGWLRPAFGTDVFRAADERLNHFGFGRAVRLIANPLEGQLDPARALSALRQRAVAADVTLLDGATVLDYQPGETKMCVRMVPHAENATFYVRRGVVLAANAFTSRLLPEADLRPGRGQVIVTEPVAGLPFRGAFHFQEGYYYFRNVGDRVLLGGGRQLDVAGETTDKLGEHAAILADLRDKLSTVVLPGRAWREASRWSGIMAFGADKQPVVRLCGERTVVAARLSGMGVALSPTVGERAAALLADEVTA